MTPTDMLPESPAAQLVTPPTIPINQTLPAHAAPDQGDGGPLGADPVPGDLQLAGGRAGAHGAMEGGDRGRLCVDIWIWIWIYVCVQIYRIIFNTDTQIVCNKQVLSAIQRRGLRPDVITYTGLIQACSKGCVGVLFLCAFIRVTPTDHRHSFIYLFKQPKHKQTHKYTTTNKTQHRRQAQKALSFLDAMQLAGVRPDAVAYSAAIEACARGQGDHDTVYNYTYNDWVPPSISLPVRVCTRIHTHTYPHTHICIYTHIYISPQINPQN